jgi:hypothetical protein
MSTELFEEIGNDKADGYDCLDALVSRFRIRTREEFARLVKKFVNAPWEGDENATDYLCSMRQLRERINNFDDPPVEHIRSELFIIHIINQLPARYNMYKSHLYSLTSIPELIENVRMYAKYFESASKRTSPPVAVNTTPFKRQPLKSHNNRRPQTSPRQYQSQKPLHYCTYCGRRNHSEQECRVKKFRGQQ